MKSAGRALLGACATLIALAAVSNSAGAAPRDRGGEHPRVITDGRLRPGHFEAIRVAGFPGKGEIEVSFFPTAICEDECSARSFRGESTNSKGSAKFRVRVPGTFFDHRGRPTYFRDGERIELNVVWE